MSPLTEASSVTQVLIPYALAECVPVTLLYCDAMFRNKPKNIRNNPNYFTISTFVRFDKWLGWATIVQGPRQHLA
jgi:hypothetical protein